MTDAPTIPGLVIERIPEEPPPAETIYLVAACWHDDGWTIIRRNTNEEYRTIEAARAVAADLSPGWKHRRIVEIKLGPESPRG